MFSKCVYTFFLILNVSYLTTSNESTVATESGLDFSSTFKCLDCREENKGMCRIEDTGYSCYTGPHFRNSTNLKYSFPKTSTNLDVCIPTGINIESEDAKICCIWSPDSGCQILVTKDHEGEFCFTCRMKYKMEYEGLKSCPCKANSGSGQVYSRTLHFMILKHLFNKLIHSLSEGTIITGSWGLRT
ncbi:uncharacterized protein LOC108143188 [Drosophila elegans]|uniref:uncharacterized protein LOC108143188 n=1 Tax=Drosophila elegans TaxID=30023 RepID=UPI0007E6F724|nr:uncharacterized protein LOC108143188 [Drosophila elegans]